MKCENCCYYGYSEEVKYQHCLFREIHNDYDVAPCDDSDFDDVNPGYEEY